MKKHATRIAALAVIGALYLVAQQPELDSGQRQALAGRFAFTPLALPAPAGETKGIREVNPALKHIDGWISAVGAAVALADIDGDGLSNDICHVETRADRVYIAPAPGTGQRFAPLDLDPAPLPYDARTMAPMGCLPGDLNEDGRSDLLVYYWGRTPVLFLADGSGYRPVELTDNGERWFTNTALRTDLDGDGHTDLVIGNYFQDGARILDANARQSDAMQHSMSRAFNAGGTYFFLWHGGSGGDSPTVAFRQADAGLPDEILHAWTLGLGAQDLDGDLLPELYFANDFGPDRLLHNRSEPGHLAFEPVTGERDFTIPASKVVGRDSFKGMGVDFADINADGVPDIYVSNIAAEWALEESHFLYLSQPGDVAASLAAGVAPYRDQSEALGLARSSWSWDARLADFDNDSVFEAVQATGFLKGETNRWPELHEVAFSNDELLAKAGIWARFSEGDDLSGRAHNPFFARAADGRYYDLAVELGLDREQVTRGIAIADIDGDGDLDFAIANQWDTSFLYRNDCPACGAFLGLHLRFPRDEALAGQVHEGHPRTPGSAAIGARATLLLADGRRLTAQVDGGNGHSGKRAPELHFGLGDVSGGPLTVRVEWRDRLGQPRERELQLSPGWHTVELDSGLAVARAEIENGPKQAALDEENEL